jgi:hypothetical protein
MNLKTISIFTILASAISMIGCGGTETANTANANVANANTAKPVTNSGLETTKKPEAATSNDAPTIAPVVRAYYEALKKKDDAGVKAVMSQEFLKSVQADMKDEKRTDLAGFMGEYEKMPEKTIEVRNEKIEDDKAVAEIKGGTYVNWTPFAFIKENGSWKFTGGSPDIQSVTQSK